MRRRFLSESFASQNSQDSIRVEVERLLALGHVRFEKCDLGDAESCFHQAFRLSQELGEAALEVDCLAGLVRLSGESLDFDKLAEMKSRLDLIFERETAKGNEIPYMAWYIRGALLLYSEDWRAARGCFHRCILSLRKLTHDTRVKRDYARTWLMIANSYIQRGYFQRADSIVRSILQRFEEDHLRSVNGIAFTLLGAVAERDRHYDEALKCFEKAYSYFLSEHNWFHHLQVLIRFARVSRLKENFSQAIWYLDLVESAANGSEFGNLKRELNRERAYLEKRMSVDLIIDPDAGTIQTHEKKEVSLRKQYVLLDILKALSVAHLESGKNEGAISKADLIQRVWRQKYRPDAHDNKLYYNINRLRKLIEPNVREPKYVLNWKQGYRLAPGLKVRWEKGGVRENLQ